MKSIKEKGGITLIALAVTIVVILILSAVTITFVLGEDGIINKAKEAANAMNNAVANEQKDLENLNNEIDDIISQNLGYTLRIKYIGEKGEKIHDDYVGKYKVGEEFIISNPIPENDEYVWPPESGEAYIYGIMPKKDLTINVKYLLQRYNLTINYVDQSGNKLHESYNGDMQQEKKLILFLL